MLGSMALGSAVFQTTRLAVLSRLASSPAASFLTRGLGAQALAWGAGLALEIPAFSFSARGLHQTLGVSQDWSQSAITRDLLSNGLTLFLLKGFGAAGTSAIRRIETRSAEISLLRLSRLALPQAAAFTGILASQVLETRLGLRPRRDAGNVLVDSLATLLQFHVGGRLLQGATGQSYEGRLEALHRTLVETRIESPFPPSSLVAHSWPNLRPSLA